MTAIYYHQPIKLNAGIDDYAEMTKILKHIKARFILSLNDHPEIRELFKGFNIQPVMLKYSVSKGEQTAGKELLNTNYNTG